MSSDNDDGVEEEPPTQVEEIPMTQIIIAGEADLHVGEETSATATTSEGGDRTAVVAAASVTTTNTRKQRRNAKKRAKQKLKKQVAKEVALEVLSIRLNKLTTTEQHERWSFYQEWMEQLVVKDPFKFDDVDQMFCRIALLEELSIDDTPIPDYKMGFIRFLQAEPIIRMEMISSSTDAAVKQKAKDIIHNHDYLKNLIEEEGTEGIDAIVEVYENILPKLQTARYFIGLSMDIKTTKRMMTKKTFPDPPRRPECEICLNAMPLINSHEIMDCCGKRICPECVHESRTSQLELAISHRSLDKNQGATCPFCRSLLILKGKDYESSSFERLTERVAKYQDTNAMYELAVRHYDACNGGSDDKEKLKKGAEWIQTSALLGRNPDSLHVLGYYYIKGLPEANIERDMLHGLYFLQLAAYEGGVCQAWERLGQYEDDAETGMYHYRVAAAYGSERSLQRVKDGYQKGYITKTEFAETLRKFHAAKQELYNPVRMAVEAKRGWGYDKW